MSRLQGVSGDELQAATFKSMPHAKLTTMMLSGRQVTFIEHGAWPVWSYATGNLVFQFVTLTGDATQDQAAAARILALLP